MKFAASLCSPAKAELEWMYLVNETLEGEKCIVPALKEIAKHPLVSGSLKQTIDRQIDEEVDHVRLFHRLVGAQRVKGSGFREKLSDYVMGLESVTLKLFALQGMLEGIALGALKHRLANIDGSPSRSTDLQALADEEQHVALSFGHFSHLIAGEGLITNEQFKIVSRDVSAIFSASFKGEAIASVFKDSFGVELNANDIENSQAMKSFRALSGRTVIENRNLFIKTYFDGRKVC